MVIYWRCFMCIFIQKYSIELTWRVYLFFSVIEFPYNGDSKKKSMFQNTNILLQLGILEGDFSLTFFVIRHCFQVMGHNNVSKVRPGCQCKWFKTLKTFYWQLKPYLYLHSLFISLQLCSLPGLVVFRALQNDAFVSSQNILFILWLFKKNYT